MSYHSSRSSRKRRGLGAAWLKTGAIVCAFGILFAYGIWQFRFDSDDSPVAVPSVRSPTAATVTLLASPALAASSPNEATLNDVSGGSASGRIVRDRTDGRVILRLKAAVPDISRDTYAYEAWVVRPVPYDYRSIGEFVTNDDGEWVLEWESSDITYDAYSQVVVTLEPKDGDPDPSIHILEGEFK